MTIPDKIGDFTTRQTVSVDFINIGNDVIESGYDNIGRFVNNLFVIDEAVTVLHDGKVQGIGGFVALWEGVAECWSIWTVSAGKSHRRSMVQSARLVNEDYVERHKIWRVQATLKDGLPSNWMKHIGFEPEGVLRNYCMDGNNAIMYSRIYKEHLKLKVV